MEVYLQSTHDQEPTTTHDHEPTTNSRRNEVHVRVSGKGMRIREKRRKCGTRESGHILPKPKQPPSFQQEDKKRIQFRSLGNLTLKSITGQPLLKHIRHTVRQLILEQQCCNKVIVRLVSTEFLHMPAVEELDSRVGGRTGRVDMVRLAWLRVVVGGGGGGGGVVVLGLGLGLPGVVDEGFP